MWNERFLRQNRYHRRGKKAIAEHEGIPGRNVPVRATGRWLWRLPDHSPALTVEDMIPVGEQKDRTVPVGPEDFRSFLFVAIENVRMGVLITIIETATDDGDAGIDFVQKRFRTGGSSPVMRRQDDVAFQVIRPGRQPFLGIC